MINDWHFSLLPLLSLRNVFFPFGLGMKIESKCRKCTADALRLNNQNRCSVAIPSYTRRIVPAIPSGSRGHSAQDRVTRGRNPMRIGKHCLFGQEGCAGRLTVNAAFKSTFYKELAARNSAFIV